MEKKEAYGSPFFVFSFPEQNPSPAGNSMTKILKKQFIIEKNTIFAPNLHEKRFKK